MTASSAQPSEPSFGSRYAPGDQPDNSRGFGSAAVWTVLGTIVPGVGLLRAGRRLAGWLVLGLFLAGVVGLGAFAVVKRDDLAQLALDPNNLYGIAAVLLVLALVWVAVITATHLALRSFPATAVERIAGGVLVGILSFAVAAPMALGANYAYTTASVISTIFDGDDTNPTGGPTASDPWANLDRLNILILGGDSGVKSNRSRAVGARTDTVMVASIDTHTGATTLITLPRNAEQMPFPADSPLHKYYPNGFYKPGALGAERAEYLLNAMYRNVPARVPNNVLGKTKDFGASAMMQSVGYALGLDIDYYVFVNMDGFKDFVNAIGGLTVNVNYAVPIGGHNASPPEPPEKPAGWIEPGPEQHLDGRLALWFARGRYHLDDYSRMERQRCVIYAVTQQTTPAVVLTNYESIARTGEKNITTNIPRTLLPAMAELGLKVKDTKTRSLVLDPSTGFLSYKPDWNWVRAKVKKALKETTATTAATPPPSSSSSASAPSSPSSASAPSSPSSTATAKSSTKSDDLATVCSYHPKDYKPTKR
jgi:LCP family protein required for cell wall assembly